MKCPFCRCEPFEYVDVGIGGPGVPVAVNCCEMGPVLFDHRVDNAMRAKAWAVAETIPEGLSRDELDQLRERTYDQFAASNADRESK